MEIGKPSTCTVLSLTSYPLLTHRPAVTALAIQPVREIRRTWDFSGSSGKGGSGRNGSLSSAKYNVTVVRQVTRYNDNG